MSLSFEDALKRYAVQIGIDLIGITSAEPFTDALQRLRKMEEQGYLSPWAEADLEKRCDPRLLMADAKSIVAVGISYLQPEEVNEQELLTEKGSIGLEARSKKEGGVRGRLARFAQFQDYHHLLQAKMEELVELIQEHDPQVQAQIYVDTGPLIDREVAYRAGLGFIGKNSALIHPEYGSFLALGEILLNIPLEPDQPLEDGCGDCDLCMKRCPQQVITAPGEIQTKECLAHYTQEKGLLTDSVRRKLGSRLWGCDTCQDVCPYNRTACPGQGQLFQEHALGKRPRLEQILNLSNSQYRELVGETAMAWRGKRTLQRNGIINLGNSKNPAVIPILQQTLADPRPIIRGVSAWALAEIGGDDVETILQTALVGEKDLTVRRELEEGLARVVKNNKEKRSINEN